MLTIEVQPDYSGVHGVAMNLDQIKQRLVEISRKRVDPDPLLDETLRLASALAQQNQQLHNQLRGARFVFAQITRRRQN